MRRVFSLFPLFSPVQEFFVCVYLRDLRAILDSVAVGRAGLPAPFRGYFIVFHPADSSVTVEVAAGRIDRDETTKRLRKLLRKAKRRGFLFRAQCRTGRAFGGTPSAAVETTALPREHVRR